MTFRSTDFRTCYGFRRRAKARLGSGVRHDHESPSELPLGPRRPLSTPAGCLRHSGLARCCLGLPRGFADFDGIQAERFRRCRSIFISPLRLPISPSGQARQCTWEQLLAARCQSKAALGPARGPKAANFRLANLLLLIELGNLRTFERNIADQTLLAEHKAKDRSLQRLGVIVATRTL
jgi:hypothetical protein